MRVVLMGPPGAGKGTQAARLVERFGMAHLSSGDIFRAEKDSGSPRGAKLAEYMDAGLLVPDETVVAIMAKAIRDCGAEAGLLLDGFPRTVAQAEALDAQLGEAGKPLDAVAVILVDEAAVVERITGRRSCGECGKGYHVKFIPPQTAGVCDACGAALIQRDDDTEEVVRERLATYNRQTEPVIAYYRDRPQLRILDIDGNRLPNEVTESMVEAMASLGAGTVR